LKQHITSPYAKTNGCNNQTLLIQGKQQRKVDKRNQCVNGEKNLALTIMSNNETMLHT